MKKLEIERMQRLEDLVARQEREMHTQLDEINRLKTENNKLQGANEALSALVERLTGRA